MNIGQLFNRKNSRRSSQDEQQQMQQQQVTENNSQVNNGYTIKHSRHEDLQVTSAGGKRGNNPSANATNARRRPPSKARQARQHKQSSRSFLESNGVVFPSSFEDVVEKGCSDLKDSLKRSVTAMEVDVNKFGLLADGDDTVEW